MKEIGAAKPSPLAGLIVIEMAGLGPAPMAGLMLSEMGADVLRIGLMRAEKPFLKLPPEYDLDRHALFVDWPERAPFPGTGRRARWSF